MLVFVSVFGYILLWFVPVIPAALLLQDAPGAAAGLALGVLVVFTVALFPFLNAVVKRVFHFRSGGTPVPLHSLRERLLGINDVDGPVMVEARDRRLVVTWKYVDATWWDVFARSGLKKVYELHLTFDPERHEVRLIDISRSVRWRAGPESVRLSGGFFRGVNFTYEVGKQWGIRENFTLGRAYDYSFDSSEIRNPVMNDILRSGWDVRFALW
jgi:hypothetical protein